MTKITGKRVAAEENQGTISFETGGVERLNFGQGGVVSTSGTITLGGAVSVGSASASDTVSFFGGTPVAIQSTTATTGTFAAAAGTAALSGSSWVGNTGTRAYTVSDVISALKAYRILVP